MHSNLWLGSQTSFEAVAIAEAKATAQYGGKTEESLPELLSIQGGVGIIDIKGSLVNGNAGFMRYFGVTGYGDIRDALVNAVSNQSVSAILLNIDSGGGQVSGVHDTAQLIERVNKVKPVFSYTGGAEASAALWLGSAARKSFTAETAITGSIGIITVHAERSKQLAADGVTVTVIRAGAEKALASSYEPLSKEAKAGLEAKAQALYDVFLPFVASQRGVSNTVADSKFGQGREFVGKQAVDAGLIDAVGTFEDAFTEAVNAGKKKAPKPNMAGTQMLGDADKVSGVSTVAATNSDEVLDNTATTEGTSMLTPLTQEQLLAMASGVDLTAVTETTTEPVDALVAMQAQLDTATLASTTAQAELATAKAAFDTEKASMQAATDTLASTVRGIVKAMAIPLGITAESIDALEASALAGEYTKVAASFKDKFKVGGVAATNTTEEKLEPAKASVNPLFLFAAKSLK